MDERKIRVGDHVEWPGFHHPIGVIVEAHDSYHAEFGTTRFCTVEFPDAKVEDKMEGKFYATENDVRLLGMLEEALYIAKTKSLMIRVDMKNGFSFDGVVKRLDANFVHLQNDSLENNVRDFITPLSAVATVTTTTKEGIHTALVVDTKGEG